MTRYGTNELWNSQMVMEVVAYRSLPTSIAEFLNGFEPVPNLISWLLLAYFSKRKLPLSEKWIREHQSKESVVLVTEPELLRQYFLDDKEFDKAQCLKDIFSMEGQLSGNFLYSVRWEHLKIRGRQQFLDGIAWRIEDALLGGDSWNSTVLLSDLGHLAFKFSGDCHNHCLWKQIVLGLWIVANSWLHCIKRNSLLRADSRPFMGSPVESRTLSSP